ncbi:uncharacterized protein BJ171DRAFT_158465 [Polychytrium aggregatum]|uniref:uncharacterized protein n=1 Tax=Polychytrium aggregatum TaxID=110093 RepID=UPI0022FEC4F0|nr:uncharacterized protein BJ171DRAFT_158465 [Polychytrium aggregatum]KAI9203039.1 hypothetical protein BJ171DRAFT_158465 [Polychytrium aggregatum]
MMRSPSSTRRQSRKTRSAMSNDAHRPATAPPASRAKSASSAFAPSRTSTLARPETAPPRQTGSGPKRDLSSYEWTEVLGSALVREYLASKGYKRTLDVLVVDEGQKEHLVSSRSELVKNLGIVKLVKQNIQSESPFKSFIDIIVNYLRTRLSKHEFASETEADEKYAQRKPSVAFTISEPSNSPIEKQSVASRRPPTASETLLKSLQGTATTTTDERDRIDSRTIKNIDLLGTFDNQNPRMVAPKKESNTREAGPRAKVAASAKAQTIGSSLGTPPLPSKQGRSHVRLSSNEDSSDTPKSEGPRAFSDRSTKGVQSKGDVRVLDDLVELDLTAEEDGNAGSFLAGFSTSVGARGKLITTQRALALRCLVFPGEKGRATFTEEWKGKGFVFNTSVADLAYGLVQSKGGPCGLLAAVQALVLKHLMFSEHGSATRSGRLRPTFVNCRTALIEGITEILWQAGGLRHRRAVVALYKPNARLGLAATNTAIGSDRYLPDGITENLELHEFSDLNTLREFITESIGSFTVNDPGQHGIIQLLYSVILSRGVETIRDEDMDERESRLIGKHGYCTQEMVNLILLGQATSNVFDGDYNLDEYKILKGIKRPCQFGFLTLFEHYGSIKVGEYLKHPIYPIFVVSSESHFTVLFSTDRGLLIKTSPSSTGGPPALKVFDLTYYDGLANQDQEIVLTVSLNSPPTATAPRRSLEGDLVPPLEHCIRTKWPGSTISWNGYDPIL